MRRLINTISAICVILFVSLGLSSCDNNSTDTKDPISTDDYPTATITTDYQGDTVTEGDTVMFNITLDKPVEKPVSVGLVDVKGTANDKDYSAPSVTIPAYKKNVSLNFPVIFPIDGIPEESKTISFKVAGDKIGTKYRLNPDSKFPSKEFTIENYNDPQGLSVALDWENAADNMDFYSYLYLNGSYAGFEESATDEKPEHIVEVNGLEGEWYYSIVTPSKPEQPVVNYTLAVGYPDQTNETFEGSFNATNISADSTTVDGLTVDPNAGGDLGVRLLKATSSKNASGDIEYSVENLNPNSSEE